MNAAEDITTALFERQYVGTTEELNKARTELGEWLAAHASTAVIADAQLVLSELASNAVEGSRGTPYLVVARVDDTYLAVAVTNAFDGDMPEAHEWKPEHPFSKQGRGLSIVAALSESVRVQTRPGEVTVIATLRRS